MNLRHELLAGKEYSVGRKDSDIIIPDDMSISRNHAVMFVTHTEANLSNASRLPVLVLRDVSRHGSVVHNKRISGGQEVELRAGDTVMFGTAGCSLYRVQYEAFVLTSSCLDSASKRITRELVVKLGGHLSNEFTPHTQLVVMSKLSVTVKVISALVTQKQIVTPGYLIALHDAVDKRVKKPEPADYLPPLAESQISSNEVSFQPNPERQNVFEGKVFAFFSEKQQKKLCETVNSAGGTTLVLSDASDLTRVSDPCVIFSDPSDPSQNASQHTKTLVAKVTDKLCQRGLRVIMESELGFAILFCSTAQYCNPSAPPPGMSGAGQSLAGQTMSQFPGEMTSQSHAPKIPLTKIKTEVFTQPKEEPAKVRPVKRSRESSPEATDPSLPVQKLRKLCSGDETIGSHLTTTAQPNMSEAAQDGQSLADDVDLVFEKVPVRRGASRGLIGGRNARNNESLNQQELAEIPETVNELPVKKEVAHHEGVTDTCYDLDDNHDDKHDVRDMMDDFDCVASRKRKIDQNKRKAPENSSRLGNIKDTNSNEAMTSVKTESTPRKTYGEAGQNVEKINKDQKLSADNSGFLEARIQTDRPSEISPVEVDESLPRGLMRVVERDLVCQRPPRPVNGAANGRTSNGKPVKNFKKFRKVPHAGADGMPVIIGGSDLVPNSKPRHKEIEEWMQQELLAESQQAERNRIAQDVFDYKPSSRRAKKGGRIL